MQIRERPRQLAPAAGDLLPLQRRQQLVDCEGSREVRAFPGTPRWGLTPWSSLRIPFLPGSFESSSVLMSLRSGSWMLLQGTAHPVFPRVPHKLCQRSLCPRGTPLLRLTDGRLPCPPPLSSLSSPAAHLQTPLANEVSSRPGLHLYPLLPPPALSSCSSFRSPAWSFKMSLVAGHCRAETLPSFCCPFSAIQSPGGGLQLLASFWPGAWPAAHSTHPARFGNKASSSHLSLRLE